MGNQIIKVNFEDVQHAIKTQDYTTGRNLESISYTIINTLPNDQQQCLIANTVSYNNEEVLINQLIKNGETGSKKIIIYGKNCADDGLQKKYNQLINLGFCNVYIYAGGMFEWLMLQDIYGSAEFPTTSKELDILKFKPPSKLT